MAVANKTRNMLEGLVRDGSFKWLLSKRSPLSEDLEEMANSPSGMSWIQDLSPVANIVVRKCSKIIKISSDGLQESFKAEASDSMKHPSVYARNLLEYCCFRALALSARLSHLSDKDFRRLTFDMMVAWEAPAASNESMVNLEDDMSVGVDAFTRIASAVPLIANVVISENLFEVLTTTTSGQLQFYIYEKYLIGLERAIKRMKTQSESSLLSACRSSKGEKILEVDGTVTSQPVLEHVGISTWPGRLTLTDHALYFEALRVVSYDKAKRYDLSEDLKQIVKPELTGPWGSRLFDKAVLYKSLSLSEPVIIEFPELKGHARRDYWLAIIREILSVHRFIKRFNLTGVGRAEALSKAVLGILRVQAIYELVPSNSTRFDYLLTFNLCDQLPGGDLILDTLSNMSTVRELDRTSSSMSGGGMYSISALAMVSNLGFGSGSNAANHSETRLAVGELTVGEMSPLERVVKKARDNHKKVVLAQETVDEVKVDGIDTNLAVMKELMFPLIEVGNWLLSLFFWEEPIKSLTFCLVCMVIIFKEWLGYALALMFAFFGIFMVLSRFLNQGSDVGELKIVAPPPMNTMEQLLAVQNAISQAEQAIQDGNIILLKFRALLLSIFPQASQKFAIALLLMAVFLAFTPIKYITLLMFLEMCTRYSPPRKANTERWMRRVREWWFSIPAAPVILEREGEDKKRK